jgi:tripartite-type tricarboxylate transporter receptor subunit TctC
MCQLRQLLLLAVLAPWIGVVCAQSFPSKPIRFVVPVVAGGSPDTFARVIGQRLHAQLGQPVAVENRAGAAQMIGVEHVIKSPPDGYTVMVTTGTFTTSAAIRPNLPFDPAADLTGVAKIGVGPMLVISHPSLPVKSMQELIALARARPGQLSYATAGTGSMVHFAAEVLAASAKLDIVHVPYKSGAPAVTAVLGGEVPVMLMDLPPTWPHIKANRLRALAVTTGTRSSFVPDLPTIAEAGVPGFDAAIWWGALAPARTPADAIKVLNTEINKILASDDVKARLAEAGAEPVLMSPEAFTTFVRSELAKWRKVAKERNIQPI